eukprot:1138640-Pelagomonas_calceolata.AAC.2
MQVIQWSKVARLPLHIIGCALYPMDHLFSSSSHLQLQIFASNLPSAGPCPQPILLCLDLALLASAANLNLARHFWQVLPIFSCKYKSRGSSAGSTQIESDEEDNTLLVELMLCKTPPLEGKTIYITDQYDSSDRLL